MASEENGTCNSLSFSSKNKRLNSGERRASIERTAGCRDEVFDTRTTSESEVSKNKLATALEIGSHDGSGEGERGGNGYVRGS